MEPRDEFDALYEATHDRLITTLAVLTGSLDIAQDAADEAFERAVARWPRVSRMESPSGWIFRVALNVAHRQHRRRAFEERLGRREQVDSLSSTTVEVRELLSTLPPRQQAAMTLRVFGGLTETEIGTALGVSRSTVHSALADGRRKLAALVTDKSEGESHEDPSRAR